MKKLLKVLSILVVIALICAGFFFYSIYIAVDRVNLSYTTLTSPKIPKDMNDVKIAYITDIKYNGFMKKDRFTKMINELNIAGCDIVLFGGDMFDNPSEQKPDSQAIKELTDILSSIKAPLGKFAVLGDMDLIDDESKKTVSKILYDANFEILENSAIRIRNHTKESISLIGLDSLINGNPNIEQAFKSINEKEFNIVFTHCPDIISNTNINAKYVDVMAAGHSLGGQIYLPLLGGLKTKEGATKYNHGVYTVNQTKLFVSNGLGTIDIDMRLFAPPEILIFRLQNGNPA